MENGSGQAECIKLIAAGCRGYAGLLILYLFHEEMKGGEMLCLCVSFVSLAGRSLVRWSIEERLAGPRVCATRPSIVSLLGPGSSVDWSRPPRPRRPPAELLKPPEKHFQRGHYIVNSFRYSDKYSPPTAKGERYHPEQKLEFNEKN